MAAAGVYGIAHRPPALHLFVAVNARRGRIADTFRRYLRRLRDNQAGAGPLRVISDVHGLGHIAGHGRAVTGQGRHDYAVGQCQIA